MEDIEMKNEIEDKEKEKQQNKLAGIYLDFIRTLNTITKNVAIKDLKTLDINYRLINKYRKEFFDNDFIFLNNTFMKPKYNFMTFSKELKEETNFKISQSIIEKFQQSNEIYGFIFLILLTKLIDYRKLKEALLGVQNLIKFFNSNESLTTNTLKAKAYYYLSLITEKLNIQDEIIDELLQAYRTACIEMDYISQVTLINCIIRYYLNNKNVEMARSFISKTKYMENISSYEDARYLFYIGKIEAIQMNYSDSYTHLSSSFRKAPEKTAQGFKNLVNKYLILVQLLMGEIPDMKGLMKTNRVVDYEEFKPYLLLLKIVRQGNLDEFKKGMNIYEYNFKKDGTLNLVQRMRQVVIKAGLRKINLSYSRISIKDITEKLKLENEKETEYIVAKAIRDCVFLATINHDKKYVQSKEIKDIYSTFEPQKSYQSRILFLNNIFVESQRSMKYSSGQERAKKEAENKELEEADAMDTSIERMD
jgi:26S proteasome regulatory subunit N3